MSDNDGGLTGAQLASLLDRLATDLDGADAEQINLRARLEAQPLKPDTLEALFTLCALWWEADQPARALQAVADDGQTILAGATPAERADVQLHLSLLDATTGFIMRDETVAVAALRRATQTVSQSGATLLWRTGGGPTEANSDGYRDWDVLFAMTDWTLDATLAVFDFRWALDATDQELEDRRAVSESLFHAARAQAFHGHDRGDSAVEEARQALQMMAGAQAPQVVDKDDWLTLGDAIAEIAPGDLPLVTENVVAGSQALSPALKAEVNIRLTRLRARALHAQGDLERALALRDVTNCTLEYSAVGEDDFFEYDVPWLVEAGRFDDAGERVAMYIYLFALSNAQLDVIRPLIHERLADAADNSVWWPLCVMRICAYGDYLFEDYLGDVSLLPTRSPVHARLFGALTHESNLANASRAIFDAARQLAEERSPDNPWIERFTILVDKDRGRADNAQVAARFEALVRGGLTEGTTLVRYVMARVAAFGLPDALYIAPPPMRSGTDAMRFNLILNGGEPSMLESTPVGLQEMIEQCPEGVRGVVDAIWNAMYTTCLEQGIARMEQFFATGVGHPGDANPHYYARLCSSLALAICRDLRFNEAIALCQKGLSASPSASLYSNILWIVNQQRITPHVWKAMDAETQNQWRRYYVQNAEVLWHYVAEEGYDRTYPNEWIHFTVMHLNYLNRHDEIPLWLERLIRWQEDVAGEDPEHLSYEALYARVRCLQFLSPAMAHQAVCQAMIDGLKSQIAQSTDIQLLAVAGVVFGNVDEFENAIWFYQRHLELNPQVTAEDVKWAQDISRNLEDCRSRLSHGKWPGR